ncbi:hypothetical protein J6590_064208 [Homalodisca vitripennis]|nr:hypothetical protein J6590_064208 [Homalodisca vitripennis]
MHIKKVWCKCDKCVNHRTSCGTDVEVIHSSVVRVEPPRRANCKFPITKFLINRSRQAGFKQRLGHFYWALLASGYPFLASPYLALTNPQEVLPLSKGSTSFGTDLPSRSLTTTKDSMYMFCDTVTGVNF